MPYRQLEPRLIGKCNKYLGLLRVECDWLLHIDVASPFQAKPSNIEMAFRRRGDVNHVWFGIIQQFRQVSKMFLDLKPLG